MVSILPIDKRADVLGRDSLIPVKVPGRSSVEKDLVNGYRARVMLGGIENSFPYPDPDTSLYAFGSLYQLRYSMAGDGIHDRNIWNHQIPLSGFCMNLLEMLPIGRILL